MNESLNLIYFRIDDPEYPRNARIRAFLTRRGHSVTALPRARGTGARRVLADLRSLWRSSRRADAIIVSEMSLPSVPLAWLVARARRSVLVVDGFVGKYETVVVDRGMASPRSATALVLRFVDALAVRCSDLFLVDTELRAEALRERHRGARVISLPVGAPAWAVPRPLERPTDRLRVLFYGSYLPLHGGETIIGALPHMRHRVALTMVGTAAHAGGPHDLAEQARRGRVADRVRFLPAVDARRLGQLIAEHDVVLGLFGTSAKASSVIANKVWQGLAAGRRVVTRHSAALEEIAPLVGSQLRTVAPGDALELARVLDEIAGSPPCFFPDSARRLEEYVEGRFARWEQQMLALTTARRRGRRKNHDARTVGDEQDEKR